MFSHSPAHRNEDLAAASNRPAPCLCLTRHQLLCHACNDLANMALLTRHCLEVSAMLHESQSLLGGQQIASRTITARLAVCNHPEFSFLASLSPLTSDPVQAAVSLSKMKQAVCWRLGERSRCWHRNEMGTVHSARPSVDTVAAKYSLHYTALSLSARFIWRS